MNPVISLFSVNRDEFKNAEGQTQKNKEAFYREPE